jgi:hypothetical protein
MYITEIDRVCMYDLYIYPFEHFCMMYDDMYPRVSAQRRLSNFSILFKMKISCELFTLALTITRLIMCNTLQN